MNSPKRILGIDFGEKRIGISVSDPLNIIAQGLTVIINSANAINEIKSLIDKYGIGKIVVGMPLKLNGKLGQKADEVSSFINQLTQDLDVEIVSWDERFTTRAAHQTLREMGVRKRKRQSKSTIDIMASALILQGYLDSQNLK